MPHIELGKIMEMADNDEFWAHRGKAVQAYANLEQALCRVFAQVSDTSHEVATVIFFKITNAPARRSILETLIKKKLNNKYNLYWNSVLKSLELIDRKRNEIIHWAVVNEIESNEQGESVYQLTLRPPHFWHSIYNPDEETAKVTTEHMTDFTERCRFYFRAITMFNIVTLGKLNGGGDEAWKLLFEQPLSYPPPYGHLLSPDLGQTITQESEQVAS